MSDHPPRLLAAGESAVTVEFGREIDPDSYARVLALDARLAARGIEGLRETVPTYRSLMIHFDPRRWSPKDFAAEIAQDLENLQVSNSPVDTSKLWYVPACYDLPHGEDLAEAAGLLKMAPEKVVELHLKPEYRLAMYGFAPGYAFITGIVPELFISRRQTPRLPAPAGTLSIANGQALICSISMPTGWYVLGRTPLPTFDLARDPVFPIAIGDRIRFERVGVDEFAALERDAANGRLVMREGA